MGTLQHTIKGYHNRDHWVMYGQKKSFKNFEDFLMQQSNGDSHHLLAVSFVSPVCCPCDKMKDEWKNVKQSLGDSIAIMTIDTDKYPSLSCRHEINGKYKTY
jgi:hypothetical protein